MVSITKLFPGERAADKHYRAERWRWCWQSLILASVAAAAAAAGATIATLHQRRE